MIKDPLLLICTEKELEATRIKSKLLMLIVNEIRDKGMTQRDAAKMMGVTQPRVSHMMNGQLSKFSIENLMKSARAMNAEFDLCLKSKLFGDK